MNSVLYVRAGGLLSQHSGFPARRERKTESLNIEDLFQQSFSSLRAVLAGRKKQSLCNYLRLSLLLSACTLRLSGFGPKTL